MKKYNDTPISDKLELTDCLPPLLQAIEIKEETAKVGFDFPDVKATIEKLDEKISELKEAIKKDDKDNIFEEAGDVLFMLANLINKLSFNPLLALKASNKKFMKRFKYVEKNVNFRGASFTKHTDFVSRLYEEAKMKEKHN